jgi:hypothetical protein
MPQAPVRPQTTKEIKEASEEAFDLYTSAVGRVADAWNMLHESMAELFWRIVGGHEYRITAAVWYSSYSDRFQRQMLEAAINASVNHPAWARVPTTAREDLIWLLRRANFLGNKRDEAIHAPCQWLRRTFDGAPPEVIVAETSLHRRAKSLIGKDILIEFDWLEQYIWALSKFTHRAEIVLHLGDDSFRTWPEKPRVPDRRPKKFLQGRLRRQLPESQPLPPPTSQA